MVIFKKIYGCINLRIFVTINLHEIKKKISCSITVINYINISAVYKYIRYIQSLEFHKIISVLSAHPLMQVYRVNQDTVSD